MRNNIWEGSKIGLRAVEPDDREKHFDWNQNTEMARLSWRIGFPASREAVRRMTEETALKKPDNDETVFAIETLAAGEDVGRLNTHTCDLRNGTFSYGISIQPAHQRQGYASDAMRVLLRYFFGERRYNKVTVTVFAFNEASMKLHENFGFQTEGRLREMIYTQGKFHDMLYYGMTAGEFAQRYPGE